MTTSLPSEVARVAAAPSERALRHFSDRLALETDCADVHAALRSGAPDFVLLDVRSPALYRSGHVPGALSLPHAEIDAASLATYPSETLFVVYCAGPHCNGATKGALRIAELGRPVKEMIGGMVGWRGEGFDLTT